MQYACHEHNLCAKCRFNLLIKEVNEEKADGMRGKTLSLNYQNKNYIYTPLNKKMTIQTLSSLLIR